MELTSEQVKFIREDILERGITMEELADSLVDHICCCIEQDPVNDFQASYLLALTSFGERGMHRIQHETNLVLTLKKEVLMKKTMYVLGYIAAFLLTSGLLFKLQHWPGAAIMLTLAIALLNFGVLPIFFYDLYQRAVN